MRKRRKAPLLRGNHGAFSSTSTSLDIKHDESGQVYKEISCQGTSMTTDWKWRTTGATPGSGRFLFHGPGCGSLYDMSMRSCISNSPDINAEVLEEVPQTIGLRLWDHIVAAQLDSVQLFMAFAQRYSSAVGRKCYVVSAPNLPLPSYFNDLTSVNTQWLTYLTLVNMRIPRTELIQVSLMTNLAALTVGPDLQAPDIGVDDSLIRTWSRSSSMGAFRLLRVLVLRGELHITSRAFEYLDFFPVLAIFAIQSVHNSKLIDNRTILSFGWKCGSKKRDLEWQNLGMTASRSKWDNFSQALFRRGGPVDFDTLQPRNIKALDMLPVIHLNLGCYGNSSFLAKSEAGTIRIWDRMSKLTDPRNHNEEDFKLSERATTSCNNQSESVLGPKGANTMRKRTSDTTDNGIANKVVKRSFRPSKGRSINDLFSEFVT